MRVKILDAWAHGLAVVSTTIGAEGIECHPGEDILIADEPQEFAARLSRLLSDAEYAGKIGLAGRRQAERRYDWKNIYPAWERVYGLLPGVGQTGGEQ